MYIQVVKVQVALYLNQTSIKFPFIQLIQNTYDLKYRFVKFWKLIHNYFGFGKNINSWTKLDIKY